MLGARLREIIAISMIGEGILGVLDPQGHVGLWRSGPRPWQKMMDGFIRHRQATRIASAVELGVGIWLAKQQMESVPRARMAQVPPPAAQRELGA